MLEKGSESFNSIKVGKFVVKTDQCALHNLYFYCIKLYVLVKWESFIIVTSCT